MILRNALAEAFDACMARGRCKANDIVSEAQHKHPELFLRESERLIVKAALREAKALMRGSGATLEDVNAPNQQELPLGILPGLRPPLALAVPLTDEDHEADFEYVRYDCATWEDLEAALDIKTTNVDRAITRKEDHLLKMDALRLYLQGFSGRTVAEACELMKKDSEVH